MRRFLVLLAVLFLAGGLFAQEKNDVQADIKKLEKFLSSIDKDYVDAVSTHTLVEDGIKEILSALDPHSIYLDAEAYARSNEPLQGKFKGIGIRYIMVDDTMTILDVSEGSAAELASIRAGDQILVLQDDTVAGVNANSSEISIRIKEQESDLVRVWMHRKFPSAMTWETQLKKGEIEINSVPASFMLENRIGYLKLDRFSSNSLKEFRAALDELNDERMKYLVLDLRGNGGGYLNVAIKIVDEFLEDRKLIVYTEGVHQERRDIYATSGGRYTEDELYILIDANSASASEILAGAIQDWNRGLVLGRRSFGKGLVQRTVEFEDGSAMRLTISRYYTPTGRSIQRSYEEGLEAYQEELKLRRETGEFFDEAAMMVNDSLVYYTPNKRKVFGGGGIVPDVFIPLDTNAEDLGITRLQHKGLVRGFAIFLAGLKDTELRSAYPSPRDLLDGFVLDSVYQKELEIYLAKHDEPVDQAFLEAHHMAIEKSIKTTLVRLLFGYRSYHEALAYYDEDIHAVLEEIERGTFKELGLK